MTAEQHIEEIPKVQFRRTAKVPFDFEILTLSSLLYRNERLDYPLDKPRKDNFFIIIFITKGAGTHTIDFEPYEFTKGDVLFISKGQVHSFEIKHDREGFLILFTEDFLTKNLTHSDTISLQGLYNYHLNSPLIQPVPYESDSFEHFVRDIYEEFKQPDNFAKEEILRLLLKTLLLKAERIKRTFNLSEKNLETFEMFTKFRHFLEDHIAETRNAKDYAQKMHISYKHLNEICKATTGRTAKDVIDNFLVLEIKRHLAISDISVKELAYKVGFDEPTNFVKYFKKQTGRTPVQFKNSLIN